MNIIKPLLNVKFFVGFLNSLKSTVVKTVDCKDLKWHGGIPIGLSFLILYLFFSQSILSL